MIITLNSLSGRLLISFSSNYFPFFFFFWYIFLCLLILPSLYICFYVLSRSFIPVGIERVDLCPVTPSGTISLITKTRYSSSVPCMCCMYTSGCSMTPVGALLHGVGPKSTCLGGLAITATALYLCRIDLWCTGFGAQPLLLWIW